MKKIWMILCLIFIASFTLSSCNQKGKTDDIWEQVRSAPAVKLESAQQNEEPIFVDNTGSVTAIADMRIQPSDQTFDEEWIYRFSYNPHEKVLDSQEIVILFGDSSLSADGTTHLPEEGVPYDSILEWAESLYQSYLS